MRRLARWLFTLCSAVSLVLCLAVCVLWVRSYRVAELLTHRAGEHGGTRCTSAGNSLTGGSNRA